MPRIHGQEILERHNDPLLGNQWILGGLRILVDGRLKLTATAKALETSQPRFE